MDERVKEHFPLVHSIVNRYCKVVSEREDFFQVGCIGLLKAWRRFESSRGTAFSSFAVPYIAGEIKMYLREQGLVKYSRLLKEKAVQVKRLEKEMMQRLGRSPTLGELSAAAGIDKEELATVLESCAVPASLSESTNFDIECRDMSQPPVEMVVDRVALHQALGMLPARERQVALYRFFRGLSQKKTAILIGVSQVHISRLERGLLEKLKKELEPY